MLRIIWAPLVPFVDTPDRANMFLNWLKNGVNFKLAVCDWATLDRIYEAAERMGLLDQVEIVDTSDGLQGIKIDKDGYEIAVPFAEWKKKGLTQ